MHDKNLRLFAAAAIALSVVGCAMQPAPIVSQKPVLQREQIVLSIAVAPRIGLFNGGQFTRNATAAAPDPSIVPQWTRDDYMQSIPTKLRDELPIDWDLLTTGAHTGYESRRLQIAVSSAGQERFDCHLVLVSPDEKWRRDINGCAEQNVIIGNGRFDLRGTIETTDGAGHSTSRLVEEVVPEDHLIVSIGDSFGSGEGNPDRVRQEGDLFGGDRAPKNALWMDERCHRSAWAGPIRAGLSLIKESLNVAAKSNGLVVRTNGAYTIASVACSGATIYSGVLGQYQGRLALPTLAARDPRVKAELHHYFDRHKPLDSQITQIAKLMQSQNSDKKWEAKKLVDAVVVSVGGNDIYFANLVSSILLERFNSQDDINDLTKFVEDAVSQLPSGYSALDDWLKLCEKDNCPGGVPGDKINARQVLITAYPNPTRRCAGQGCYCSGPISKGFFGNLMSLFGKRVTDKEAALAEEPVLRQLNGAVAASAKKHGWRYVEHDEEFLTHGWCLGKPSGDAYATSETWIRDADDSNLYQGDFYGTMHPTWEGHQAYMKVIRDALQGKVKGLPPSATNDGPQSGGIALLRVQDGKISSEKP